MSFKTRLILSYIVMFIAPIVLTAIASFIIIDFNARSVAGSHGFDNGNIPPIFQNPQRFRLYMGIAVLLILVFTNGILTYFVSRSVLRPIEKLKDAANHIKGGNLEFTVKPTSNDEIGELCIAFEKMREKLKESIEIQIQYENNRKELISNISHDLKTPVTAIKGYVEGIIDGVADSPDKMDRYIKTIYSKATDLDNLIDELFLFSKLDLNKLPFDFEEIDIIRYFQDCVEELSLDLEKNNIFLSLKIGIINNPIVIIDKEKLKRVIINIVQNSSKYMDKEIGKIDINIEERENEVIIEIKDNGQGIPSKDIPYIFDRFYRTDISRNSSTGGSGLGLAIVKRIIEGHEGRIWAKSKDGIGTSIFFTLKTIQR